jgi:hypothetical protein
MSTLAQSLSGSKLTLDFCDDGSITGPAGCNRYFSPVYDDGNIAFDRFGRVNEDALRYTRRDAAGEHVPCAPRPGEDLHYRGSPFHLIRYKGCNDPLVCKVGPARIVFSKAQQKGYHVYQEKCNAFVRETSNMHSSPQRYPHYL